MQNKYNATQPTYPDGRVSAYEEIDSRGNRRIIPMSAPQAQDDARQVIWGSPRPIPDGTSAWSTTSSVAGGNPVAGLNVKNAPGRIRRIHVSNKNATTGFWFQIFDQVALPTSTSTLAKSRWWVGSQAIAGQGLSADRIIDFGPEGLWMATAITVAASSTIDIFTVLVGLDANFMIEWI